MQSKRYGPSRDLLCYGSHRRTARPDAIFIILVATEKSAQRQVALIRFLQPKFEGWTETSTAGPHICFLADFDRWRPRRRTPGPPPFSSMNSTPAASSVRRTAKSLAIVIDVSLSASSALLIVARPKAASRASSAALHRRSARAARICALFKGFRCILTRLVSYDTFCL
jgi:hypothetical protein